MAAESRFVHICTSHQNKTPLNIRIPTIIPLKFPKLRIFKLH